MTISNLGCHVQAFFADYLAVQRGLSPHTIASYRDAIKLLLVFAARHQRKTVAALTLDDLGPDVVLAFLDDLEKSRGNSIRTRNARLAAIHSLFGYVACTIRSFSESVSASVPFRSRRPRLRPSSTWSTKKSFICSHPSIDPLP